MISARVLYLNRVQAAIGRIDRQRLPRDYVLACRFFHCGIIDRTHTLDTGFAYQVLDPIPPAASEPRLFGDLCDARGEELVELALRIDREIALFWSGGIDSTAALIAIERAAERHGCVGRIRVMLSLSSVQEYPRLFLDRIHGRLRYRAVSHPVADDLDPRRINVTGEHGDQLFGSQLLRTYVQRGVAFEPWEDSLPLVMIERLRDPFAARRVYRYLLPVLTSAPVPLRTLFDAMWWFNFALKWQDVMLRLIAGRGTDAHAAYGATHHFFRTPEFQAWALANTPGTVVSPWSTYKQVAKRYILDATGDRTYFLEKEKEDSLRNVLNDLDQPAPRPVFMTEAFQPVTGPALVSRSTRLLEWVDHRRPSAAHS